jgi:hypothetical protein
VRIPTEVGLKLLEKEKAMPELLETISFRSSYEILFSKKMYTLLPHSTA